MFRLWTARLKLWKYGNMRRDDDDDGVCRVLPDGSVSAHMSRKADPGFALSSTNGLGVRITGQ